MAAEVKITAPDPERARALLELVESFLLKKPAERRGVRKRMRTPQRERRWMKHEGTP